MNPVYIKNVTVADTESQWNRKKVNILVENGKITSISESSSSHPGAEVLDIEGAYISRGWVDLRASFCDPGYEYREDILSGLEAAAYGGFTGVAIIPETRPLLADKSTIEYVSRKASGNIVTLYPLASITSDTKQEDLTEMFDVIGSGAKGFSSGKNSIGDSGFLVRAMEYAGMTDSPIMVMADNKGISAKGMVNEGQVSVRLGLKGMPAIAEETDVFTIIKISEYTGRPVHISCVSTKAGMQAIESAQVKGIPVSADVSIHHLQFEEEDLGMFDTNLKLKPPLRTKTDRDYLRAVVKNNLKIAVVSDHNPYEEDRKRCEFEMASFGAIGIQTVFSQLIGIYGPSELDLIINILNQRSSSLINAGTEKIAEGAAANLTVFDPEKTWVLNEQTNHSKSKNSPVWNQQLKGKALAILNNGMIKILE